MSLSNLAARGAVVTLGGQGLRFALQMTSLIVLARLLSPDDYGVITMVTAISGVAAVIGDFGLSMAAVQARELNRPQKSNLFWLNTLIGVGCGALVFALAHPIAAFYGRPDLVPIAQILSLVFVFSGVSAQFKAEINRGMRFGQLVAVDVGAQVVSIAVAVVGAALGFGYWALVAQQVSLAFFTLVISVSLAHWLPGLPSRKQEMKALLSFGANTMAVQLVTYISSNIDSVVIGRYWGASALGLYSRAFQLFMMPMQQLATPTTRVALPVLSQLDDRARYQRFLQSAQLALVYVLILTFGVAAATAIPLFAVLFGNQWSGAVPIFQVLAVGGVFQAMSYCYYWVFLSKGLTGLQLRFSLIGRAIMIGLIIAAVPLGPVGVAAAYSLGLAVIWGVYSLFAVRRAHIKVLPLVAQATRPTIIALTIFGAVQLIQALLSAELGSLAMLGADLGVAILIAAAFFVFPVYRRDLRTLRDMAARVTRRGALPTDTKE